MRLTKSVIVAPSRLDLLARWEGGLCAQTRDGDGGGRGREACCVEKWSAFGDGNSQGTVECVAGRCRVAGDHRRCWYGIDTISDDDCTLGAECDDDVG